MCQWCLDASDPELARLFHDISLAQQLAAEADKERGQTLKQWKRRQRKNRQRNRARRRDREALGTTCHYCDGEANTVDHIVPKARSGPVHNPRNIVASCSKCNQDKADNLPTCSCKKCREALTLFWPPRSERRLPF